MTRPSQSSFASYDQTVSRPTVRYDDGVVLTSGAGHSNDTAAGPDNCLQIVRPSRAARTDTANFASKDGSMALSAIWPSVRSDHCEPCTNVCPSIVPASEVVGPFDKTGCKKTTDTSKELRKLRDATTTRWVPEMTVLQPLSDHHPLSIYSNKAIKMPLHATP